jgi:hypothetical protein
MFLKTFNIVPKKIDETQIEKRNNVIHDGYIPKYNEVVKYADYLLNYMVEIVKMIRKNFKQEEIMHYTLILTSQHG